MNKPYQTCHAMYARYMRCLAELGRVPPSDSDGTDLQSVAAGQHPHPALVCGLLWRSYPEWSFLAAHRSIVQDKAPPPAPEWYGQGKAETFLEDAGGRVLVDDPDGCLAGLPSGVVLCVAGAPSPTLAGGLRVSPAPVFPGGVEGTDWVFDDIAAETDCCGGLVARFHQATPGRPWPAPADDGPWCVVGDVLGGRLAALTAPKPPGCSVVPGGRDPCGSTGFPRAPLPDFLASAGGFRPLPSPHYDPVARVLVQDGSAVDDMQRAIAPGDRDRASRAVIFARSCLLWRNLAPTAADTLPCPTRAPVDTVCPPWPVDAPPLALVLGAGGSVAARRGSVALARNPRLGVAVLVVALGTEPGFTQGALLRAGGDGDGGGPLSWSWLPQPAS